jgi:hypothetical protein
MTASRVSGLTCPGLASVRLTVAVDTPARSATSPILGLRVLLSIAANNLPPAVTVSRAIDSIKG